MKTILALFLSGFLAWLASPAVALSSEDTDAQREARMKWWTEARFGMFIHWGLYALPARHEWVKQREAITVEDYQEYFKHFNPDLYDPKEWARLAKKAGMKYFVVTTKHHEGFCLWDSKYTDYKAANTPYGKDLIKPMVEAFRAEGLRVGFYHSLLDWHHPEYTVDKFHPMFNNSEFREKAKGRDIRKYAEYLHNQVREILTGFGRVEYAQLLNDASEIRYIEPKNDDELEFMSGERKATPRRTLTLRLPVQTPDVTVPVLELFLN